MAKEDKETQAPKESAAVYVPWASFKSAIEQLVVPNGQPTEPYSRTGVGGSEPAFVQD